MRFVVRKSVDTSVRPIFCPKHLEPSHGHEVTRSANPAPLTLAGQHGMFIKRRGSRLQAHKGIATAGSRDGWGHERVANSDAESLTGGSSWRANRPGGVHCAAGSSWG